MIFAFYAKETVMQADWNSIIFLEALDESYRTDTV